MSNMLTDDVQDKIFSMLMCAKLDTINDVASWFYNNIPEGIHYQFLSMDNTLVKAQLTDSNGKLVEVIVRLQGVPA